MEADTKVISLKRNPKPPSGDLFPEISDIDRTVYSWETFYLDVFGLSFDFIPEKRHAYKYHCGNRRIAAIIPPELEINTILEGVAHIFENHMSRRSRCIL